MDSVFQGLVESSTTGEKLPLQVPSARFCKRVCRRQAVCWGLLIVKQRSFVRSAVAVTPLPLAVASRDRPPFSRT